MMFYLLSCFFVLSNDVSSSHLPMIPEYSEAFSLLAVVLG